MSMRLKLGLLGGFDSKYSLLAHSPSRLIERDRLERNVVLRHVVNVDNAHMLLKGLRQV
jgi:hypothetical protein